jgi:hypothetical protein
MKYVAQAVAIVGSVLMIPVIAGGFVYAMILDAGSIGVRLYEDLGEWTWS